MTLVYSVRIEVPDEAMASELLDWLEHDHASDVVRAGALMAEVVRLDGEQPVIETRYHFASREAFEAYEAGPAVLLRAEGRERFGPERGVKMIRSVGVVRVRRP